MITSDKLRARSIVPLVGLLAVTLAACGGGGGGSSGGGAPTVDPDPTPVPGDDIRGYISLGRGITIHRADCPNVKALMRNPERFTAVEWEGDATSASFRAQIAVDAWDRARLLEDVARTFAEHGANIVAYGGTVEDGMARNWYTAEIGDVKALRSLLGALRNLEAVFDAYRMTPGG